MSADELIKLEAAMQQNMVLVGFKIHERQRQMEGRSEQSHQRTGCTGLRVGWPENR